MRLTSVEWISSCLRLCRCSDLEAASLTAIGLQLHDGYLPTLTRDRPRTTCERCDAALLPQVSHSGSNFKRCSSDSGHYLTLA